MNLYLDLETIPTQRQDVCDHLEESLRDELTTALDSVCAPANYKDPEKIEEYIAGKRASLQSEFRSKLQQKIESTGLDGAFGQVFCIGWAVENDHPTTVYSMDERTVLTEFARLMRISQSERFNATVIGHNVASFDLRFLTQRYIVNGIRPPMVISRAAQAKPWEAEKVFDTMVQWCGPGSRISLDKLCLALAIPSPKVDFDGSMVWQYVQEGKHDEVARYCERDVLTARLVHQRMTFQMLEVLDDVPA